MMNLLMIVSLFIFSNDEPIDDSFTLYIFQALE